MIRRELSESELMNIRKRDPCAIPITLKLKGGPFYAQVVYHKGKRKYFFAVWGTSTGSMSSDQLPSKYLEFDYPGVNYLFLNEYENEIKRVLCEYHTIVKTWEESSQKSRVQALEAEKKYKEYKDNLSKIWKRV